MKLFLAGQKAFGAAVLEALRADGHAITGVSAPLGGSSGPDRLRAAAAAAGVPLLAAGTLAAETLPPGTELIVCAHSHDFVGRRTRLRAPLGAIGYHPSLLPLHRGRDAVRWALAMRERVTGGSVYLLTDNVDAGPVLAQRHVLVRPGDTPEALWRRELFPLGVRLLREAVDRLDCDPDPIAYLAALPPQEEALATWEPSWDRAPLRRPDLHLLPGRRLEPTGVVDAP